LLKLPLAPLLFLAACGHCWLIVSIHILFVLMPLLAMWMATAATMPYLLCPHDDSTVTLRVLAFGYCHCRLIVLLIL